MLIQYGQIISNASGKLGGTIFSKNKSGAYVKTRSTIRQPNSLAQLTQRVKMVTPMQTWKALTDDERLQWNNMTVNYPVRNRLGNVTKLSGYALFCKLNVNLAVVGESAITTPSLPIEVKPVYELSAEEIKISAKKVVKFKAGNDLASKVKCFASYVSPFGSTIDPGRLRLIKIVDDTDTDTLEIQDEYAAVFGNVTCESGNIFIKLVPILKATGQEGAGLITTMEYIP